MNSSQGISLPKLSSSKHIAKITDATIGQVFIGFTNLSGIRKAT